MAGGGALTEVYPAQKEQGQAHQLKRKEQKAMGTAVPSAKRPRPVAAENRGATAALVEEFLERETRPFGDSSSFAGGQTDFSGLIPRQGKEQQQGEAGKGPRPGPKTFADIASASARPDRAVLGELLANSNYLPPVLPAFAEGARSSAAPDAAAHAAADRQLPASTSAPVDWSLKTAVRFSSPLPFTLCQEAQFAPSRDVVDAHRNFASPLGTDGLSLQQQYLAALLSYQYPQGEGASRALAGGRAGGARAALRLEWQAALGSLYDSFRCGRCDAFYVVSPQSSKRPFVAFFGAAGVAGRPRVHALLTRTTPGLRALIANSLGVGFALPLLLQASRCDPDREPAGASDGTQSLAVFEGAERVHGAFDLLLNESMRGPGDEGEPPVLLAPAPFLHGALRVGQAVILGAADAGDGGKARHGVELRGLLPPWVVDRLLAVMAAAQAGSISMACDTHPLTLALNWRPAAGAAAAAAAAPSAMDDYVAREGGCLGAEEAARWRAPPLGLACNVVRELHCEGGAYVARLSARSAERAVL